MTISGMMRLRERRFLRLDATSAVQVIANPLLRQLYSLWAEKCVGRPAPARHDFFTEELRPWLGHLMILDCVDCGDFRYRLYGTGLVGIFGFDLTNTLVSEAEGRIGGKPMQEYREVCRTALPVYVARSSPSSREYLEMDKLALPLMENGVVNKILGAIYLSEPA